jgi:hypothetical protein
MSGKGRDSDSTIQRFSNTWSSSQSVDGFFESRLDFCRKALTHAPINAQHFDGGEGFGFEAQQFARIGHAGLPADGKVLALETIRAALGP